MHQTRQETTIRLPIRRKGTKYIARALIAPQSSVPVVLALRDMLKLAHSAKEVKEMIKDKLLKINSRIVTDYRESVQLFNLLSVANKTLTLSLNETGKFEFAEAKDAKKRICKIIGKKIVSGNRIQINMHDGTNAIGKKDMKVNDSVYLDSENKVVKHVPIAEAKEAFVFTGKYSGKHCVINSVKDKKAKVSFKNKGGDAELELSSMIAA
jgi:small subunit ribosomal protein S4e